MDLDAGIARVSYTAGGAHFVREVFTTAVDQVLALRFTCDRPGGITCGVRLTRSQEARTEAVRADRLVLRGATNGGKGMKFEAHLRAIAPGGKLSAAGQGLKVAGADSLVLLFASATTYRRDDPATVCQRRLEAAAAKGFEALRADHLKDHQAMFRRVKLELENSPRPYSGEGQGVRASVSPLPPAVPGRMGEGQGVRGIRPSHRPAAGRGSPRGR